MGQIRPNFKEEEFECKCGCGGRKMTDKFLDAIQELRDRLGKPIYIMSGHRCLKRNQRGGVSKSRHLPRKDGKIDMDGEADASDIQVEDMTPGEVKNEALRVEAFRNGGIGVYHPGPKYGKGWLHVDSRGHKARWERP